MTRIRYLVLPALIALAAGRTAGAELDGAGFFTAQIGPLLETHCLKCHSHAGGKMKGGLTLDSRSGWTAGGENGPAIVPGKPEESLLIKAIRYGDPDLQMPPKNRLPDEEVDLLVAWVKRGAPDPRAVKPAELADTDWWSLRKLKRPPMPAGDHPIDAFVAARLQAAGLAPGLVADRRTLIRRVYQDLHGLQPAPEEVAAFVGDPDPSAYEKLVDGLLASPRYGERWARHWLDVIHFADSHGCEHDVKRPNAWRFRDYVIERLNADVPWGRFIREQLAADVFYPEEPQLTRALGFIAAGPLELSRAGTAPVTFDYLDRDDMVTQTMAAFVSTTANCARCHTHKFDPISQEDYYSLQAVFAGVGKGDVTYDQGRAIAARRKLLEARLTAAAAKDAAVVMAPEHSGVVRAWERAHAKNPARWEPLAAEVFLSNEGATLTRQEDGSILLSGILPERDTYTVTSSYSQAKLTAIRLDVLADDSLPKNGPGRAPNGNLHLSEFEARVFEPGAKLPVRLKIRKATADWDQSGWTIAHALDGKIKTAWGIHPREGESHQAVFELERPVSMKPGSRLVIALRQLHGGSHLIGRFRLLATGAGPGTARLIPPAVLTALKVAEKERTPRQQTAIAAHAIKLATEQELASLPPKAVVYAVSSSWSRAKKLTAPQSPKVVHLLRRGDIAQPVREVGPGALSALTGLPGRFDLPEAGGESARRAALADWLAAPDNPLTWRSVVNRVWHHHFGRGLCDTPNDFGRMGGAPSHPELLDWLAVWFRDEARGSLKELHRLILTSRTWRQSSDASAARARIAIKVDAGNRLLWRMNRERLDAGMFRDSVLRLAGRLDLKMGGPGGEHFTTSKGAQATPKLDYAAFDWNTPEGARRSIYRVVWRGIPDPFMEAMDFPDLGLLAPKRGMSVSALQSLAVFNNDFVLHAGEWLAERVSREREGLESRVERAVGLAWLRRPAAQEMSAFVNYAREHGVAAFCRLLMNSNEFLFVD